MILRFFDRHWQDEGRPMLTGRDLRALPHRAARIRGSRIQWYTLFSSYVVTSFAFACRVDPDYVVPSHFELVKGAEVIVLARAVEFRPTDGQDWGEFRFQRIKVLKGQYTPEFFEVSGTPHFQGRTAEDDLRGARPGAYMGSCTAQDYRVDRRYVLFGHPRGDRLLVGGPPFSRVNEEVDGEHSPWTQLVSRYAEIAVLEGPDAQISALRDLRQIAEKGADPDRIPPAVARYLLSVASAPEAARAPPEESPKGLLVPVVIVAALAVAVLLVVAGWRRRR